MKLYKIALIMNKGIQENLPPFVYNVIFISKYFSKTLRVLILYTKLTINLNMVIGEGFSLMY